MYVSNLKTVGQLVWLLAVTVELLELKPDLASLGQ